MNNYNFVYKTTNNLNGDYYYGVHSTNNLDDGYMGSGVRINRSINKYGKENFTREIVQFFSNVKCAFSLEMAIVTPELIEDPHCLNLATGGFGGYVPGHNHSEETKQKMRHSHNMSDNNRQKLSDIAKQNKGRKHSEETKQKISKNSAFKDPIKRQVVIEKLRMKKTGKPISDKHKQSISTGLKGKIKSSEHLKHLSESLRNSKKLKDTLSSTEYRTKMSNSLKGMIFINNGLINKRVKDTDKELFLINGWQLGRIKKNK